MVANLSTRNYELKEEIKDEQILNRGLQAKMGCYKMLVEELQKERKNIKGTAQQKEERLRLLEFKNKALNCANKQLILQISGMADWLAACQDYQTVTDRLGNRSEVQKTKKYVQCFEDKLEGVQQQQEKEKQQMSQLKDALRELTQICESQRNDTMQLKGELETCCRGVELWVGMRKSQGASKYMVHHFQSKMAISHLNRVQLLREQTQP